MELTGTYVLRINEKCPHIRLDHNEVPRTLRIEGQSLHYNLKYCYVSQRGYYPNGMMISNVYCGQLIRELTLYTTSACI